MRKPNDGRRRTPPTRRNFNVKAQLVGKLGPRGYGRLLEQLEAVSVEERPKRRRRRARRPASVVQLENVRDLTESA